MGSREVLFFTEGILYRWPKRRVLRLWLQDVAEAEAYTLQSLRLVICSSERQQALNSTYLGKDSDTDVISFDLREASTGPIDGEVYVSLPYLRSQARAVGVPIFWELAYVVLHGLLHLCGYDDKTAALRRLMRTAEAQYMALLQQKLCISQKLWNVSRET